MEIDFETWKEFVEGAKIVSIKLVRPNSLFVEFDTGMVCYIYADAEVPIKFDFNWLEGYEPLSKPALEIYTKKCCRSSARK